MYSPHFILTLSGNLVSGQVHGFPAVQVASLTHVVYFAVQVSLTLTSVKAIKKHQEVTLG